MKLQALTALFLLNAANAHNIKHRNLQVVHKRQATTSSGTTSVGPSSTGPSSGTGTATAGHPTSTPPAGHPISIPSPAVSGVPPLESITFGMPSQATLPVTATYAAGATPPVSGAPALPTTFVFKLGEWPDQDKIPDTSSPEVQNWMKELEGFHIPDIAPTVDGSCGGDPVAANEAAERGWWTCGGYTRDTDITHCPDKLTWGVSFDDGPSPYTQKLLNYLSEKDLLATFFVVGSRVIERPTVLLEEYMSGHEISVHTWSHKHLTSLTNEQIVAELGWTRKAIKAVLGVTPTTMRPPYGDIDDRVRAIALAMGMVPILWTRTPSGGQFDTNDWRVAGDLNTGVESFSTFQTILQNASTIETGFIVLQHDLFEITVDLAIGYTLDAALTHNPAFNLLPIGQCINTRTSDLYFESTTNKTFPYANQTFNIEGSGGASDKTRNGVNAASFNAIPILSTVSLAGLAMLGSALL